MADQLAVSQAFLAEFWEGQDISPGAIAAHREPGQLSWLEKVQAYLDGFEARDLSDAELRRCTQPSDLLFHLAVVFREAGMLSRISPCLAPGPESASHAAMHLPVADLALTPEAIAAVEEIAAERAARRVRDKLFSLWINRAPRFGSVAAHFPRSLRCRRFVASFWAPEVFFSGPWPASSYTEERFGWYANGGTRAVLDFCISHAIDRARWPLAPRLFWSPELPEVAIKHVRVTGEPGRWFNPLPILFLLLLCLALPASAQTLLGVVSRVTDGDTLIVGRVKVRLFGIDAPEGKQECRGADRRPYHCGNRARAALERLAPAGSSISCRVKDTDRYGRLVAVCSVAQRAGSDLSREMVAVGWAVAYRKYSTRYVPDELLARQARRGMWAGTFVSPEEWRHAH